MGIRADVVIDGRNCVVVPHGFAAKVLSLRSRVTIPLAQIGGVELRQNPREVLSWFRVIGTSLPGVVYAGIFGLVIGERVFAVVGRARPVVVITPLDFKFKRVVFSSDNPEAALAHINEARQTLRSRL